MRMTSRKKQILSFYCPENAEWVSSEIGPPPFDVQGLAYLLNGMASFNKKSVIESTRRTLETMTASGLLQRVSVYERRQDTTQGAAESPGVWCVVNRYGLPGQCQVIREQGGRRDCIEGEFVAID